MPKPGINTTKDAAEKAKANGFLSPFQPVNKIDGVEVSWTLGKMLLYAAGQISPAGPHELPVGFGSNTESGTPDDFEHAGSTPLLSIPSHEDEADDDDAYISSNWSTYSLLALLALLLLLAYIYRRPERRRRLLGIFRRRRRPGSAKGGASFARRLFGRNTAAYERVMEEGDAVEFELGDVDSDDHEYSDSSEDSRSSKNATNTSPRRNIGRFEELQPISAIDRKGLVIRTESRDRIAPTLQMLNAGRRSRAGSPTRLKSPLMTPMKA